MILIRMIDLKMILMILTILMIPMILIGIPLWKQSSVPLPRRCTMSMSL